MDSNAAVILQSCLRSSEIVRIILSVFDPPTDDDGASPAQPSQDPRVKKLLALVTHEDPQGGLETGW